MCDGTVKFAMSVKSVANQIRPFNSTLCIPFQFWGSHLSMLLWTVLDPYSAQGGNMFLLTIMCLATDFPEVVLMYKITAATLWGPWGVRFFFSLSVTKSNTNLNVVWWIFAQLMKQLHISHCYCSPDILWVRGLENVFTPHWNQCSRHTLWRLIKTWTRVRISFSLLPARWFRNPWVSAQ